MVIKVKVAEYLSPLQTHEDGSKVLHLLKTHLLKRQTVELDFSEVDSVTSSFVNTSIVLLLQDFDFVYVKQFLKITKTNSQINRMISYCLETAIQKAEK